MNVTHKIIPDLQLEEIKKLTWKEADEISEIALLESIAFHTAFIRWKTK